MPMMYKMINMTQYLNDADPSLKRLTGKRDWRTVGIRPCPPLHPGTPAGVWLCRQSADDRPHAPAPSSHIYLQIGKNINSQLERK